MLDTPFRFGDTETVTRSFRHGETKERGMGRISRKYCPVALLAMLIAISFPASGTSPALAQSEPGSKSELKALKDDVGQIKTDLEEVKRELRSMREYLRRATRPAQPSRVEANVSFSGSPTMGKKDAPVTLVEFSDYQCPFCRRFFQTTLPAIKAEYIDTGKVRYVFRDFPLDQMHPQARKAAEAAHCAGDQGKYWEMHDALFQNQQALQVEKLKAYARSLNLNAAAFDACLDKGKYGTAVQKNYEEGVAAQIRGTPAFFVGKTRPDNTIQGVLISGAHPIPVFRQEIERLLQQQ